MKPDNSDNFLSPVWWADDRLMLVDQRLLPAEELDRAYGRWEDVADAIRTLVVRGAPAIGVAAAFGVALAARQSRATTFDALFGDLEAAIKGLAATRPTAVNLFWALERMRRVALASVGVPVSAVRVVHGEHGRDKLVRVTGLSPAEIRRKLAGRRAGGA